MTDYQDAKARMGDQLSLLTSLEQKTQAIEAEVYRLLEAGGGQWWTARRLGRALAGVAALQAVDRALRAIAERSQGRIISGQRGYKLTRFATNDEIDHAEAWLVSQGRKMIDRAREIRIARNRGGVAA